MSPEKNGSRPLWQKLLGFSLAYLACIITSRLLSSHNTPYISIWLPAGLYVAILLLADTTEWLAVALAFFLVDIGVDAFRNSPLLLSVLLSLSDSLEALTGAFLFRRFVAQTTRLTSIREFFGLLVCSAVISPALGATLGAAAIVAHFYAVSYPRFWIQWWIGNSMAVLLVAPFVLIWAQTTESSERVSQSARRLMEGALLAGGLLAASWQLLVVGGGILSPGRSVLILFVLWSAVRFGLRGVSVVNLLSSLLLVFLTSHFLRGIPPEEVTAGTFIPQMQLFLAVSAAVGLIPAIVIAERDRLVQQLGFSEERFRNLSAASHESVVITENGTVVDANDQALGLFGYGRSEFIGIKVAELISPESRALVAASIASDIEVSYEHRLLRKDGGTVDAEARAKVMRFGGRKIRMTAIRDVTERRRAEAALRESEERHRSLIETSPESIIVQRDGVIVYANPAAVGMHGAQSAQELIGRQMLDLVHRDFHELVLARRRSVARGVETVPMVYMRFLRLDGTPIEVEVQSVGSQFDGAPAVQITSHDVTERRIAEEERLQFERKLQETQKLESLGVLAGGIAHDFNNILTGIMGNASMANLDLPPSSPVQDYLAAIKEGARRASELCRQMLAYSGKGRFVVQNLSLNRLVEETTHLLQISISKKAVLRYNLYPTLPAITADATQIRQVIMNLVINASEAIGEKSGVISLNTGLTRVDHAYLGGTVLAPELPEGTYVHLEVSDSGCGMNPETQARIFDPFFTTKFAGRGLGLAAVLGIVRGHKGALKIYSEVGRGTTFKLLFPCAAGSEEMIVANSEPRTTWRGDGSVLVVDDEESVRSAAAIMLERLGFRVSLACDGREAVKVFQDEPDRFTLILMDLTMPHLDGESAFTELRRIKGDVRVVLMSGFNEQEAISRFTGKGLASFLQKPFGFDDLNRVLQGVFSRPPGLK